MQTPEFAVYAFTPQGLHVAARLCGALGARLYLPERLAAKADLHIFPDIRAFSSLARVMDIAFAAHACHVFIGAAGIAVRAVAPHLAGKEKDPAVVVLDQRARYAISLLSGHLGGANAYALRIAGLAGAVPVITTATDTEGLPAIDMLARERGLAPADAAGFKAVSAALVAGEPVGLYDPYDFLGLAGGPFAALFTPLEAPALDPAGEELSGLGAAVFVTERRLAPAGGGRLMLHPRVCCAGVGCKRGAPARDILAAISECFALHGIAERSLRGIASITAKAGEAGLLEAASALAVPVSFYRPEELALFPVTRPSPKAAELFGVGGVCEPAALAAASEGGARAVLLAPKTVLQGVTVAIAAGFKQTPPAAYGEAARVKMS